MGVRRRTLENLGGLIRSRNQLALNLQEIIGNVVAMHLTMQR